MAGNTGFWVAPSESTLLMVLVQAVMVANAAAATAKRRVLRVALNILSTSNSCSG
ncbi:hypothetical protein D3C78_1887200 [compost metagenome]